MNKAYSNYKLLLIYNQLKIKITNCKCFSLEKVDRVQKEDLK